MASKTRHLHRLKKVILNIIKFGITFGILFYLYRNGMLDFSRVTAVLAQVSVSATAFCMLAGTTIASVIRWRWLLKGQNLQVSRAETFKLTMIGVFFNTAIPGAVSGDLVKGYYVVRQQADGRGKIKAFTTLLIDRLMGLSALICVSFLSMVTNLDDILASPTLKPLCGLISILFGGVLVFYILVLVKVKAFERLPALLRKLPAGEYFGRLFEAVKAYESCRHYVLKGFLISMLIHVTVVGVFIVLGRALGGFEAVPLNKFFFLVPFGLLVTAIPIAPAGLGTGHAAFVGLFNLVGASGGADLFTAYVSFQILISLIGGLFYLKYRLPIPPENA